jgi:hypothetical protein
MKKSERERGGGKGKAMENVYNAFAFAIKRKGKLVTATLRCRFIGNWAKGSRRVKVEDK